MAEKDSKLPFLIESKTQKAVDNFLANWDSKNLFTLPELIYQANKFINSYILNHIFWVLETYCKLKKYHIHNYGNSILSVNNQPFTISLTGIDENTSTLKLLVISIDSKKSNLSNKITTKLSNSGPYNELHIQVEMCFSSVISDMSIVIKSVVFGGYRCLESYINNILNERKDPLTKELYRIIRKAIPIELESEVRLFTICNSKGYFILDEVVQNNILSQSRNFEKNIKSIPIDVLCKLIISSVPPEITSGFKEVIPQNKCFSYRLPYMDTFNSQLGLPQYIAFGKDEITIQPIVGLETSNIAKNGLWITASYSQKYQAILEPRLSSIREQASQVVYALTSHHNSFKTGRSIIKKAWESLELKPGMLGFRIDLKKLLFKQGKY